MKKVILYTDGACSYNPGPGGWGYILVYNQFKKEASGFEDNTTNNRMELMAVIKGLEALNEAVEIDIYTDSAYIFNAFEQDWVTNWEKNNWVNSNKKPVLNKELWVQLLKLLERHIFKFHKVKGHSTDELNNRCDYLATNEVKNYLKAKENSN